VYIVLIIVIDMHWIMISLLRFCVHVFANKIMPRVVDEFCAHFLSWYAMSSAKIGQILTAHSRGPKFALP